MTGPHLPRRKVLLGGAALTGAGVAGDLALTRPWSDDPAPPVPLGTQPTGLPTAQHSWNTALATDEWGNRLPPRHHRLLLFDLAGPPTRRGASIIEAALRTLERRWPWGPDGLLFTLGWGPGYFEDGLGIASPVEKPRILSAFEAPVMDDYAACLHLASDDGGRLAAVAAALTGGKRLPGADRDVDLGGVLALREVRTGFVGAGLPAHRQRGAAGIPAGCPVSPDAPLFMGFKSSFRGNQPREGAVTIPDGPLGGGTTMHVSRIALGLDSWYGGLDADQRAARMFAPQLDHSDVENLRADVPLPTASLTKTARRYHQVGHTQAAAAARREGRPIILRRDFNTDDDGAAGVHFVALQASIGDFVATRQAMNAAELTYATSAVKPQVNNGIKEWMRVTRRANYLVPPRGQRAFPLLGSGTRVRGGRV